MKPTDTAYIAGIVDGEGSIAVSRTTTNKSAKGCRRGFAYRANLSVAMTDRDLLEWMRGITGVGQICTKKVDPSRHKPAWTWSVWSVEASVLLAEILPYLRTKKRQAENLIAFQKEMRYPGSKGLSDAEWDFRELRYLDSKTLNKRGIAA